MHNITTKMYKHLLKYPKNMYLSFFPVYFVKYNKFLQQNSKVITIKNNKPMGNQCCDPTSLPFNNNHYNNKTLIVATLNYGGILNSPFQFYSDNQKQEQKISQIFCSLLPVYIKNFNKQKFTWKIGKIDSKLQKQRYAAIYNPDVGIHPKTNKLIDSQTFRVLWKQYYQKGTQTKKIEPAPTSDQINMMMRFDQMTYHTILIYLYEGFQSHVKLKRVNKQIWSQLNPKVFKKFMRSRHDCAYLDQQKKIKKINHSLMKKKADVLFIQQPTDLLIKQLKKDKNLIVKQKGRELSLVAVNKTTFFKDIKHYDDHIKKLQIQGQDLDKFLVFQGNDDSISMVIDNYIFISVHLCSKAAKNPAEVKSLKLKLQQLVRHFPEYHIVVGTDANSYLDFKPHKGLIPYQIFPDSPDIITTCKKRTFIQPQYSKAGQTVQQCKDHIISNLKMVRKKVMTMDDKSVQFDKKQISNLLPTNKHPFDHFMVVCQLQKHYRIGTDNKLIFQ